MPLQWIAPPRVIAEGCDRYADALQDGIYRMLQEEGIAIAAEMRANAPWQDRTGAARAGLRADVTRTEHSFSLAAGHTVRYGVYLELGTSRSRPFPIINPTLEKHYSSVMAKARRLVGG